MVGHTPQRFYRRGRDLGTQWKRCLVDPTIGPEAVEKRISFLVLGIQPGYLSRPTRRLITILT